MPNRCEVLYLAFFLVSLICISVFCASTILLSTIALWYSLNSGGLIPPFFFLKIALAIQGLLCFHTKTVKFFVLVL